jgi:hypothetical protein
LIDSVDGTDEGRFSKTSRNTESKYRTLSKESSFRGSRASTPIERGASRDSEIIHKVAKHVDHFFTTVVHAGSNYMPLSEKLKVIGRHTTTVRHYGFTLSGAQF